MAGYIGNKTVLDDNVVKTSVEAATDSNTFTDADHSKLNAIEASATADQTAAELLTAIKTVDGTGTGLDADLLDGQEGSYYTGYADTAVANLVDSSPAALNTLNELAAAIGDDANFSTTITNSIATKMPLAGGTFTGDVTFTGASYNAVWDKSDNALKFADNTKLKFGADPNLEIYHDGGSSYIDDIGSGSLAIRTNGFGINMMSTSSEMMGVFTPNGAVELYHDNAKKFETTSTGIDVTGNATFADNGKAIFGAGSDLQLYHNGSYSVINNSTGSLQLQSDTSIELKNQANSENYLVASANGAVQVFYDNSVKFATTSTGIDVTGAITVNGSALTSGIASVVADTSPQLGGDLETNGNHIITGGSDVIKLGNSSGNRAEISHTGTATGAFVLNNYAGDFAMRCVDGNSTTRKAYFGFTNTFEDFMIATPNDKVQLNFNNSEKLKTTNTGIDVTGAITVNGAALAGGASASADLYIANPSSATSPTASGTNAVAIGDTAVASGEDAVSIGDNSVASGLRSISLGGFTDATANYAAAIGAGAQALGEKSLAIYGEARYQRTTAIGQDSNSNVAIAGINGSSSGGAVALGGAFAGGVDSFAGAITNNTNSYGATGANSIAIGYQNKSTGSKSVSMGSSNFSTGSFSTAIGTGNYATHYAAVSIGSGNLAYAGYGVCMGYANGVYESRGFASGEKALARTKGQFARASGGQGSAGDMQTSWFTLNCRTTDATTKIMGAENGSNGTTSNDQIFLPNDSAMSFTGTIVACGPDGTKTGSWEIKGHLKNAAGTTTLPASIVNTIYNPHNWTVALTAHNAHNSLRVSVTGEASLEVWWSAQILSSEAVNN